MYKIIVSLLFPGLFRSLLAQEISIDQSVSMLAPGDSYTIGSSVSESDRWPHQKLTSRHKNQVGYGKRHYPHIQTWTGQT